MIDVSKKARQSPGGPRMVVSQTPPQLAPEIPGPEWQGRQGGRQDPVVKQRSTDLPSSFGSNLPQAPVTATKASRRRPPTTPAYPDDEAPKKSFADSGYVPRTLYFNMGVTQDDDSSFKHPPIGGRQWVDRATVAATHAVSVRLVSNWQHRRAIPYRKYGRAVAFDLAEIERTLSTGNVAATRAWMSGSPGRTVPRVALWPSDPLNDFVVPTVRDWVNKKTMAQYLNCSQRTINLLMRTRCIPFRRLPDNGHPRFDPLEVDAALAHLNQSALGPMGGAS